MATQKDRKLVFKTNYRLMQVKSIAECSEGSILQYFRPSLSYHLSKRSLFCLFLSGCFTQVLLYFLWSMLCSHYSWSLFRYFALYKGLLPKVLRLGPGKLYSLEIRMMFSTLFRLMEYSIKLPITIKSGWSILYIEESPTYCFSFSKR